jgi:surface antigen
MSSLLVPLPSTIVLLMTQPNRNDQPKMKQPATKQTTMTKQTTQPTMQHTMQQMIPTTNPNDNNSNNAAKGHSQRRITVKDTTKYFCEKMQQLTRMYLN